MSEEANIPAPQNIIQDNDKISSINAAMNEISDKIGSAQGTKLSDLLERSAFLRGVLLTMAGSNPVMAQVLSGALSKATQINSAIQTQQTVVKTNNVMTSTERAAMEPEKQEAEPQPEKAATTEEKHESLLSKISDILNLDRHEEEKPRQQKRAEKKQANKAVMQQHIEVATEKVADKMAESFAEKRGRTATPEDIAAFKQAIDESKALHNNNVLDGAFGEEIRAQAIADIQQKQREEAPSKYALYLDNEKNLGRAWSQFNNKNPEAETLLKAALSASPELTEQALKKEILLAEQRSKSAERAGKNQEESQHKAGDHDAKLAHNVAKETPEVNKENIPQLKENQQSNHAIKAAASVKPGGISM